jgi:hypothetical protein
MEEIPKIMITALFWVIVGMIALYIVVPILYVCLLILGYSVMALTKVLAFIKKALDPLITEMNKVDVEAMKALKKKYGDFWWLTKYGIGHKRERIASIIGIFSFSLIGGGIIAYIIVGCYGY